MRIHPAPCLRAAALVAVVAGATVPAAAQTPRTSSAPLTFVYDDQAVVQELAFPANGAGLTPARGAFRQDPGAGGMLVPGDNGPYKVAKVSGRALASMTPATIAATLKRQITQGDAGATSHMVSIDEIGKPFGDAPAPMVRNARLPAVGSSWAGARFTAAMTLLNTPSPYGGTWASRVHVYLAPAVHTAIGAGRGRERNLGRDGKPHFTSWRAVMPGLALAGGLHLQMYHGYGGSRTAFTAAEWRSVPAAFTGLYARYGGNPANVHFLFSQAGAPAGAPAGCGAPVACSWTLAESTPAGKAILANGPGVYRIGSEARDWLAEYNKRFN